MASNKRRGYYGVGRSVPDHIRRSAIAAYQRGDSVISVAREAEVGRATIYAWLNEAGVELRDKCRDSDENRERLARECEKYWAARAGERNARDRSIVDLYNSGITVREVAQATDKDESYIYTVLRRLGVKLRSRKKAGIGGGVNP